MTSYFKDNVIEIADASVWDDLPTDLQAVPAQVTALTGIEVEFHPMHACKKSLHVFEKATAVLDIDSYDQRIVIWCKPEQMTASILGHELIHLRRDILEQVPKMHPYRCSESDSSFIYMVENELEHLLIIPEELKRFQDSEDRWAKHYEVLIETIVNREEPELVEHIMTWMQLRSSLPNQLTLAHRFSAHMNSQGSQWVKTCDYIRYHVMESIPDKARLLTLMTGEISQMSPRLGQSIGVGIWGMFDGNLSFSMKMLGGKRVG